MTFTRSAGVLLHPTSFPSRYGIGDLGEAAYRFVDFLEGAGQTLWQVLPLGPTGYGDSPYQCFSAFAGNPMLIDPEQLIGAGLLTWDELNWELPDFPHDKVDYGWVINWKLPLLKRTFYRFRDTASPDLELDFKIFCVDNAEWLDDYALFMALKDAHGGAAWNTWELDIRTRKPEALARWRGQLAEPVQMVQVSPMAVLPPMGTTQRLCQRTRHQHHRRYPDLRSAGQCGCLGQPRCFLY